MTRCEHCDLPLDQCEHGQPTKPEPLTDLVATGPTIEAQYDGTECVGCGSRIHQGQEITHTPDGWAHADEVQADDSLFEGII